MHEHNVFILFKIFYAAFPPSSKCPNWQTLKQNIKECQAIAGHLIGDSLSSLFVFLAMTFAVIFQAARTKSAILLEIKESMSDSIKTNLSK